MITHGVGSTETCKSFRKSIPLGENWESSKAYSGSDTGMDVFTPVICKKYILIIFMGIECMEGGTFPIFDGIKEHGEKIYLQCCVAGMFMKTS